MPIASRRGAPQRESRSTPSNYTRTCNKLRGCLQVRQPRRQRLLWRVDPGRNKTGQPLDSVWSTVTEVDLVQERSDAELARLAAREARRLHSGHVGPEHVLLGLFESEEGSDVAAVFQSLGRSRHDIEMLVAATGAADQDRASSGGIVWSPAAQVLLAVARGLALAQGSRRVTSMHVLVALAHDSVDPNSSFLAILGVGPDKVLAQLLAVGEVVPTVPLGHQLAGSELGPRVLFPAADARAVIRSMLKACPPGVRWGWNVSEDGQYWVQASQEVSTEEIVREAVSDGAAIVVEPQYRERE